jgi:hypothetical protein
MLSPPGVPFAPGMPGGMMTLPPTGVPMAGPGMIPPGAVAAAGAMTGAGVPRFPTQRTQVRFLSPSGMQVAWFTVGPAGQPTYSESAIEVPGRYNFAQGAIYRLKLTNVEGQGNLEFYPTLEVVPANPRTEAFLAHSSVPVAFTKEDFRQVAAGNYLVKVIYLPSPAFQDLAVVAPGEIVSTQLEPGANPITEACRRGDILLIIRMGNMLQELPNSPAINAPSPFGAPIDPHGMAPGPMGPVPPGQVMPFMTPNPIMGPGGPMASVPGLPPAGGPVPGMPAAQPGPATGGFAPIPTVPVPPPAGGGLPVTKLPDAPVQQASATAVPPPPGSTSGAVPSPRAR